VEPGGKGIVGGKPPGLLGQDGEDILGDLLRRAGVLDFAKCRTEDQVHVPAHYVGKGRLLALAREALQQLKILTARSSLHIGCRRFFKPKIFLQLSFAPDSRGQEP
jgi:hypothetical protein